MSHLISSTRVVSLAVWFYLFSQCYSSDVLPEPTNTTTDKLRELSVSVRNMESFIASTTVDLREKFERFLTEREQNITLKHEELDRSLEAKMEQLETTILERIASLEGKLNATNAEVTELTSAKRNAVQSKLKCMSGWMMFENSCYYISVAMGNWQYGRKECLHMGADYIKIDSDAEFNFIRGQITQDTWIGMSDIQEEGVYRWISDNTIHVPATLRSWWHVDEPNNYANGDCIYYRIHYGLRRLDDRTCHGSLSFICETMADSSFA